MTQENQPGILPVSAEKVFAQYTSYSPGPSLTELALLLLAQQQQTWPQLISGYASLSSIKLREFPCGYYSVFLQFNPGRIVSTSAKVDAKTISQRRCFLCVPHLPPEQKGILYNGTFLLLCNPAPIFQRHYTISHINHTPQTIKSHFTSFLQLAKELSPLCSLFYNGPKCGASAPDHMHFQANPSGSIPLERDILAAEGRELLFASDTITVVTLKKYHRQILAVESSDPVLLEAMLKRIVDALRFVTGVTEEPLMNLICSYADQRWRVIIIPRTKHRPDIYFKGEQENILISPAAVDIGGLVVTPREKDFESVDKAMLLSIFEEVSIRRETLDQVVQRIRR
ncbi:MAG: DUF4922 domain-containing protein [bacterium]